MMFYFIIPIYGCPIKNISMKKIIFTFIINLKSRIRYFHKNTNWSKIIKIDALIEKGGFFEGCNFSRPAKNTSS